MPSTRQLAAIMFTDIVGYTALMGRDERKAFELLDKNRQIQRPIIEEFNGKFIKELGDGILASFHTVSEAVMAAIKIQENCNFTRDYQLRIGIDLGEVVFENDDVFGDGVNIASRIQAVARPGCIFISETIHHSISNKKEFQTKFISEASLKNIKDPVRIYEIVTKSNQNTSQETFKTLPEKSIAVLPFINMSSDSEQEYFSDGISEDIIAHISKIRDFKVISRTSVMRYKLTKKSVSEISNELNVSHILEGSVRRAGHRLRIVVQLIDAAKDEHLWSETYDRDVTDVFAIQTEIAVNVATCLKTQLTSGERTRIADKPTANLDAYNFYLLGRSHYHKATSVDFDIAITFYAKAIAIDPGFAVAYAALAVARLYLGAGYWGIRPNEAMPEAFRLAQKALELDPNLSDAYTAKAELYDWYYYDWEKAEENYKLALELNPSNASAQLYRALHLITCRRYDEAIKARRRALDLDPYSTLIRLNGYFIPMLGGRSEQSLVETRSSIVLEPTSPGVWFCVGLFASQLGLADESVSAFREACRFSNNETFMRIMLTYGLARAGHYEEAQKLLSEIHELEKTEFVWPMGVSLTYAYLGQTDLALDYLEKSYEERVGWMLFIGCDPSFDILRKEERFKQLVRKIGPPEAIAEIDKFR